jgi:hypothetical protein
MKHGRSVTQRRGKYSYKKATGSLSLSTPSRGVNAASAVKRKAQEPANVTRQTVSHAYEGTPPSRGFPEAAFLDGGA